MLAGALCGAINPDNVALKIHVRRSCTVLQRQHGRPGPWAQDPMTHDDKDGGQGDGGDRGVGASVERIARLVVLVLTEPESNT